MSLLLISSQFCPRQPLLGRSHRILMERFRGFSGENGVPVGNRFPTAVPLCPILSQIHVPSYLDFHQIAENLRFPSHFVPSECAVCLRTTERHRCQQGTNGKYGQQQAYEYRGANASVSSVGASSHLKALPPARISPPPLRQAQDRPNPPPQGEGIIE